MVARLSRPGILHRAFMISTFSTRHTPETTSQQKWSSLSELKKSWPSLSLILLSLIVITYVRGRVEQAESFGAASDLIQLNMDLIARARRRLQVKVTNSDAMNQVKARTEGDEFNRLLELVSFSIDT
ncbi:hypothetical protein Tco_1031193 [Tanacetum coccineum]|uniref:Uncharacterized protein n=1 Tax=Tanacetum coccineum TaxID=301880 RepID=A0ABQ5GAA7_9ASTR